MSAEERGYWHYVGDRGPFEEWVWVEVPESTSTATIVVSSLGAVITVIGLLLLLLAPELAFMAVIAIIGLAGFFATTVNPR